MCEPMSAMMAAVSAGLNILQQTQHAATQRGDYNFLAAQQRTAAAADETRAQQAEQAGESDASKAQQKAVQRLGSAQARMAAQGTDLLGSPLDVLGDISAAGAEDALSLRYQSVRDAWENRVRGAGRQAQARYYETAAGNVDPTLGIAKTLLS